MAEKSNFYKCGLCGNLVYLIDDGGGTLVCCGQDMLNLIPGSVDASLEKHVPVPILAGNIMTIKVGELPHPMTQEHHIEWIFVEGASSGQLEKLPVDGAPEVTIMTSADVPLRVYAYCNLHGLWVAEVK